MPDSAEENVACRICMDSKDNYVYLLSHDLSKKLMEISDVQVEKDDGLPDVICTECESDLEKCYEFRIKVQVADKKFRENIRFSQVDIEEYNIKEERDMDDGSSENIDDRDSVSMDEEHCNDEPEVLKNREETEEAKPDPLNHVVVVEGKRRKIEMSEDPLIQDEAMIEEPQVKTSEEPAPDPLFQVCKKEESEADIMDVEGSQTDPFGPSSSVRSTELSNQFPISSSTISSGIVNVKNEFEMNMDEKPILSSLSMQPQEHETLERIKSVLLPASDSQGVSFTAGENQHPNQGFMLIPQTGFNFNSGILIPCVKLTSKAYALPQENKNYRGTPPLIANSSSFKIQNVSNAVISIPHSDVQNSSMSNKTSVASISHVNTQNTTIQPTVMATICDSSSPQLYSKPYVNKQTPVAEVENIKRTKIAQSSSPSQLTPNEVDPKSKKEFFCSVCNIDCGSNVMLDEHKSGNDFMCRTCTVAFNNHQELEAHFFSHKKYTCEVCKQTFYVGKDLYHHKKTVSACNKTSRKEKCKLCDNRFVHKINLQTHMKEKHPNAEYKTFTCLICKRKFRTLGSFGYHMKYSHTVYESVECHICQKIIPGPEKLKNHIKAQHLQRVEGCPICKKCFTNKYSLSYHMEKHNGKEIVCDICEAVVKGKLTYEQHMLRHKNKTHRCQYCNETFKSKSRRDTHCKIHSKICVVKHNKISVPAICEVCGKKFKSPESLRNHRVTHSDVKPFKCGVCGAAFKMKAVLITHSRIHTDLKKYSCDHCGEGFRWKQTFDKHVLKCESSQNDDIVTETENRM